MISEVLDGVLLGDGSLRRLDRVFPCLHITQAVRHIDWLYLIQRILLEGGIDSKVAISNKQALLWTKQQTEFIGARLRFYSDERKKIVPLGLRLSPVAVLLWYIGDGSLTYGRGVSPQVNFATHGFTRDESELLGRRLKDVVGVDYSVVPSGQYHRLNILGGKNGLAVLFSYMDVPGLIPPSYEYKFRGFLFKR